jgi:hypothetical protein
MGECKECGKYFHTCGSCGLWGWEWDFDTRKCYDIYKDKKMIELSKKYNIEKNKLEELISDIDNFGIYY